MTQSLQNFADDIFSIKVPRRKRSVRRQMQVEWPCGSKWEYSRDDLDIPAYENGEQNGVTLCYTSLAEAKADLEGAYGCIVRPYKPEAAV